MKCCITVHRRWLKTRACVFLGDMSSPSVIGDEVDMKLHYIEPRGGGFFAPFVHVDRWGGM